MILALNETRKTLLASRLHVVVGRAGGDAVLDSDVRPGDGLWIRACNRVDASLLRGAVDLVFLDDNDRVVDTVSELRRGAVPREVGEATAVLELAAGTVRLTNTEKGDSIVAEAIGGHASAAEPRVTYADRD